MCSECYQKLDELKTLFPKNKLLKHLISSAWGHLNSKRIVYKTLAEMQKMRVEGITIGNNDDNKYKIYDHQEFGDGKEYYVLLDCESPYSHNIRLKPFVTAYGRNEIGKIAMKDIDHVIRVHR